MGTETLTSAKPRKRRRWLLRMATILLAFLLVGSGSAFWYVRSILNASLPVLHGEFTTDAIKNPLTIERDQQGVPTIIGTDLNDMAFGLGVLHAQDRFFQMDLLRRKAAGELAALVGSAAVPMDVKSRKHRFRARMKAIWEAASPEDQEPVKRYCQGVAWGLQQGFVEKGAKPFEYHLLQTEPQPWQPEDCLLCVCAMYLELHDTQAPVEMARTNLYAALPEVVAQFFDPDGTAWDAAIDGSVISPRPMPAAEQMNLRTIPELKNLKADAAGSFQDDRPMLGSNNWAVAGKHSKHGGALIADDMHLAINLPNIWYRACLKWTDADGTQRQACGVTLPGGPSVVAGSNGYIAWGFTNTEGNWLDLIQVENSKDQRQAYRTRDGSKEYVVHQEAIEVKGGTPVVLPVFETQWGPVCYLDKQARNYAVRWVAHDPQGVNLNTLQLLKVRTLETALDVASTCGIPHQNFVCGDRSGRIAWTIAGRIPRRTGTVTRTIPAALQQAEWNGFLNPAEYPRVVDPEKGRIWTANNRVVGGEMFAKLGNAGVDIGLRAGQIRDRLMAIEKADEKDMLAIQLDDEARSLAKWKTLFLETVQENDSSFPKRSELRKLVAAWDGHAGPDGVGCNILYKFKNEVKSLIMQPIEALVTQNAVFREGVLGWNQQQLEGPLWTIITQRPMHLLHPLYETWQGLFLDAVDRTTQTMQLTGTPFEKQTWGTVNAVKVRHPLSQAVPLLGNWLDIPDAPLPGARKDLPRISSPGHGASERFAVSPGKEESGLFHMPGGQSGHPLSPNYRDGHAAWEKGLPTPFLPGPKMHTITFAVSNPR